MKKLYRIGTAGWSIPQDFKSEFPVAGTHLQRYAQILSGVEINSSFYRDHKAATYLRWADSVPEDFQFSIKLSRQFTHQQKLEVASEEFEQKFQAISELGKKWGCLLVQIPPSLAFQPRLVDEFFSNLRQAYEGLVAFEPRHETWSQKGAAKILEKYQISQVLVDPEPFADANDLNRDFGGFRYYRLHGSPEMYRSSYSVKALTKYKTEMSRYRGPTWCMFDNTALGLATGNALILQNSLKSSRQVRHSGFQDLSTHVDV